MLTAFVLGSMLANTSARAQSARAPEVLRAAASLPPHIAGRFFEPLAFQQAESGQYYVFDRRAHTVYGIDRERSSAWQIVEIGHEEGRILQPGAFDVEPGGTFVVADAPTGQERVQIFGPAGARLGGFTLPGRPAARVTIGRLVLNGVGSLQYTGRSILMSQPETGSLVTEYALSGAPARTFGSLRATGHEDDRDLHLALNSGIPLNNPGGGFYFVFQTGVPVFRKYDARGALVFERHIEGVQVDEMLRSLPTKWPRREGPDGAELPFVLPSVRTAAVDPDGNLWVSLGQVTYVYDADGDKARVVQLRGAGVISPTSLSFTKDGRLLVTPGCYEFRPGGRGTTGSGPHE